MDGHRFDEVIRSLDAARDRRGVVRGLASAALLGAAAVLGRDPRAATAQRVGTEDTRREFQRQCDSKSQCQGGKAACRPIRDTCPETPPASVAILCKECNLDGRRCCGTVGSSCKQNSCNCCGDLICDQATNKCAEATIAG